MKKLMLCIGVLIIAISFNSCSDSNDGNQNLDKVIGKWQISQLFVEGVDLELNECEKKMTIEIFENGSYTEKDYSYNETLTECMLFDQVSGTWENLGNSIYKISGINAESIKVTFEGNKIIAEYNELNGEITLAIKTIFIAEEDVVPDKIIGKWIQDQEFSDDDEIPLTDCDKMETVEFFEEGFYEEKEFEENSTQTGCIQSEFKTGIWKNIGNSMYKITNIEVDEAIKITFENDKMTVELTIVEEGATKRVKLIFIKVNP